MARRFVRVAEEAYWAVECTDEPHLAFAKAAMANTLYRRLNIRVFSIKAIMRALGCSAREADAIRNRRYMEFSVERLTEFDERLSDLPS